MLLLTFSVCGENNCSRAPDVTHMYVEWGVLEAAIGREVVLDDMYVTGAELEDGMRSGFVKDCQYLSSDDSALGCIGSFRGTRGCTSAAMAVMCVAKVRIKSSVASLARLETFRDALSGVARKTALSGSEPR